MLQLGQTVTILVEKPAAGGRMIARVDGQVVLVAGTIPGERVVARVDRLGKGVAYASTLAVEEPSPDRLVVLGDPPFGGCLYATIGYDRHGPINAAVLGDAFARIARLTLPEAVLVARRRSRLLMRACLHRRGGRVGFFREGTHDLCDARQTAQLLPATCDAIDRLGAELGRLSAYEVEEIEIAENVDASERVVHFRTAQSGALIPSGVPFPMDGLTGLTVSTPRGGCRVLSGSPHVTDRFEVGAGGSIAVRVMFWRSSREPISVRRLVAHVVTTCLSAVGDRSCMPGVDSSPWLPRGSVRRGSSPSKVTASEPRI